MTKPWLAFAAAAAAFIAACSGGASAPLGPVGESGAARGVPAVAPQPAPDQQKARTGEAPKQDNTNVLGVRFQSDRVLVLTAQLQFRASDPWSASDRVQRIGLGLGGDVVGVSQSGGGDNKAATVTIRVPNDRFNDALDQIKGIDTVELVSAQVTGEDKTEQFIDLDARLKAKQQEESRYLALLARADKIDDILKIDQVLSQVRAQIEQLQGQLNALKTRSAMATIAVSIATMPPTISPKPESGWQPTKTFEAATTALLSLLRVFADVAIWAFVWLWLPLLGLGLVFALSRGRIRPTGAS